MAELTDDEISKLRELLEIEAIRHTKLLYSHLMDTARIDDLANIFTEDAVCEFAHYGNWEGRETIRKNYHAVEDDMQPFFAMHGTCNHLVELTGPDTATGRSYLYEPMTEKAADENPLIYLGVYDEEYRKVDGRWLISRCTLQFLWPERETSSDFPGTFPTRA
ncbi:MAG: nuclear transport factor 2 family protein [Pseudomonadales bacterium]|jgi:hypothetical protein|nr:nuclear transport factor 2 family protein [Pseudomonadales bacterium]MDP6469653.1 nuclear transport factor 2 family protein [Pseudomonadales bacterium]MDP6828894.1 nuclear transport factor 2 family protein [Pseudomonadales bacterium]|tara:strand:- start:6818 stop:7306 length:489 start_codon:yes stop_codon:yes gene_type:complete